MEELRALYQSYALELWLLLAVIVLILSIWLILLHIRLGQLLEGLRILMTGVEGGDPEGILSDHLAQVRSTAARVDDLNQLVQRIDETLCHSFQWLGVVRFNPFPDTGGDQSFAIALVDDHGDGVVISSLHSRRETRVYAKPLKQWDSTYVLTDEEREAISRALQQRKG